MKIRAGDIQFQEKTVAVNRVTNVTKGGRHFSFSVVVVVGDGKGIVGHGLGKAKEVNVAVAKGIESAKKNLIKVPIIKNTIPHALEIKYGAAKVVIKPASEGTGVIAGGAMRSVLESAGVHNVLAKCKGTSNPHNVVKATIHALSSLRNARDIAIARGISMEKLFKG